MKKWSFENIYESNFSVDELIKTLEVIDKFKDKYPNDKNVVFFEDIVRDEICHIFGGNAIFDEDNEE